MHVIITSIVRNGMGYLDRYVSQVGALVASLERNGHTSAVIVAEGDSTDGSDQWLQDFMVRSPFSMTVYQFPHGGPAFGSVDNPTRWQNIARTWNALYGQLSVRARGDDVIVYVEADLHWTVETMCRLIGHVEDGLLAVSPMCYLSNGVFYDTWGHRGMDGVHFSHVSPYHNSLVGVPNGGLVRISSAGSCMVMRGIVAMRCKFNEQDAMLGHDIYAQGYELWLDPTLKVIHP